MLQKSNGDILADFPSADIPELPSGGFPVGAAGEARWDSFWATDRRAILSVGETFQVSVHVTAVGSRAAVRLLSNLNHAQGSAAFDSLDLIMQEPGVYTFQAKLLRAGRFLVYGQYTMNGTQWLWMRGEPLLLVVYPLQLRGLRMYIMIPNAAGPITHWTRHLDQIAALGYMHPGRVDVITAGALVLSRIMAATGSSEFIASESDILDGIAWSLSK